MTLPIPITIFTLPVLLLSQFMHPFLVLLFFFIGYSIVGEMCYLRKKQDFSCGVFVFPPLRLFCGKKIALQRLASLPVKYVGYACFLFFKNSFLFLKIQKLVWWMKAKKKVGRHFYLYWHADWYLTKLLRQYCCMAIKLYIFFLAATVLSLHSLLIVKLQIVFKTY